MRILLIKFRHIGDVLLSTPLIKNLKINHPDSKIDFALNAETTEMITLNPNINQIFIYDRKKVKKLPLFKKIIKEVKFAFKIRSKKYDIVINTTEGDRGTLLSFFSGASIKIGYKNEKNFFLKNVFTYALSSQGLRHIIETNLDPLRVLNLPIKEKKVEIFWSQDDEKKVENILKSYNIQNFIHFHPVSRWLFKCINDKISAQIIDFVQNELNIPIVITAAPVDSELKKVENILRLTKSKPINLAGQLTIKQTAVLNKKSKVFIGVDTAVMHISAANDIPTLAFFGPSGADHWGPWDNSFMNSGYTTRRGFRSMGKHRVIQKDLDCVPCGKDGCNGTKISDCLMNLNMEFIKKNIKEMVDINGYNKSFAH